MCTLEMYGLPHTGAFHCDTVPGCFDAPDACDGVTTCFDASDEDYDYVSGLVGDLVFHCPSHWYGTSKRPCIRSSAVCDGQIDCTTGAGEDESNCNYEEQFRTTLRPWGGGNVRQGSDIEESSTSVSMLFPIGIAGALLFLFIIVCCAIINKKSLDRNDGLPRPPTIASAPPTIHVPITIHQHHDNRAFVADGPPSYQEVIGQPSVFTQHEAPPSYEECHNIPVASSNPAAMSVLYTGDGESAQINMRGATPGRPSNQRDHAIGWSDSSDRQETNQSNTSPNNISVSVVLNSQNSISGSNV